MYVEDYHRKRLFPWNWILLIFSLWYDSNGLWFLWICKNMGWKKAWPPAYWNLLHQSTQNRVRSTGKYMFVEFYGHRDMTTFEAPIMSRKGKFVRDARFCKCVVVIFSWSSRGSIKGENWFILNAFVISPPPQIQRLLTLWTPRELSNTRWHANYFSALVWSQPWPISLVCHFKVTRPLFLGSCSSHPSVKSLPPLNSS